MIAKNVLKLITLILSFCFLTYLSWPSLKDYLIEYHRTSSDVGREFYRLLENRNQDILDLRRISSIQFDEIAYLRGASLCSLGVYGVESEPNYCNKLSVVFSKGSHLLFILDNKLVGHVNIDLSKTNFDRFKPYPLTSGEWFVPKNEAVFKFMPNERFVKMRLAVELTDCSTPSPDSSNNRKHDFEGKIEREFIHDNLYRDVEINTGEGLIRTFRREYQSSKIFSQHGDQLEIGVVKKGYKVKVWAKTCENINWKKPIQFSVMEVEIP